MNVEKEKFVIMVDDNLPHERMDEGRKHNDCLLFRRYKTCNFQDWEIDQKLTMNKSVNKSGDIKYDNIIENAIRF